MFGLFLPFDRSLKSVLTPTTTKGRRDVRFGDPLQPRREVWCLADNSAFLRLPRTNQVADDNKARGNSDMCLQGNARFQGGNCATISSPACTARSASSSWARG